MVLDLKNLTLVGQDAIAFLDRCEAKRNHTEELPSIHPRVDPGTTRRKLAIKQPWGVRVEV